MFKWQVVGVAAFAVGKSIKRKTPLSWRRDSEILGQGLNSLAAGQPLKRIQVVLRRDFAVPSPPGFNPHTARASGGGEAEVWRRANSSPEPAL